MMSYESMNCSKNVIKIKVIVKLTVLFSVILNDRWLSEAGVVLTYVGFHIQNEMD